MKRTMWVIFCMFMLSTSIGCLAPGDMVVVNGWVATTPSHLREFHLNMDLGFLDLVQTQKAMGELVMLSNNRGQFEGWLQIGKRGGHGTPVNALVVRMVEGKRKDRRVYVSERARGARLTKAEALRHSE